MNPGFQANLEEGLLSIEMQASSRRIDIHYKGKPLVCLSYCIETEDGSEALDAELQAAYAVEQSQTDMVFLGYPGMHRYSRTVQDEYAKSLVLRLFPLVCGHYVRISGAFDPAAGRIPVSLEPVGSIIRSSAGLTENTFNTAVFDKASDWVFQVDEAEKRAITCNDDSSIVLQAEGPEVCLRLRWDFIRNHRGFTHYQPSTHVWQNAVSGWCSWAAHQVGVTQKDIIDISKLFSEQLLPYGWNIIQLDDGYQLFNQRDPVPLNNGGRLRDFWIRSNERFPDGLQSLAHAISEYGLTPGIWISITTPAGLPYDYYVKNDSGLPATDRHAGFGIDGYLTEAVDEVFGDVIRSWKEQGWRYFKIDTLRHVLYDLYRKNHTHWTSRGLSPDIAFRNLFQQIKNAVGENLYCLACWGVLPELASIADGCRIGEDIGVGYDSMRKSARYISRFHYLNNIVWRNDPDYFCVRGPIEEIRTWASILALTGCQLMVSDPVSAYDDERLEILKKVGPPVSILPGNLAPVEADIDWWILEVNNNDSWVVAAHTCWQDEGFEASSARFDELGLGSEDTYLVFDFWNQQFIGAFTGSFPTRTLARGECQVLGIRKLKACPQIVGTSRHIAMGLVELSDIRYSVNQLSGSYKVPDNAQQSLFIHIPDNLKLLESSHFGKQDGEIFRMQFDNGPGEHFWSITYSLQDG